MSKAALLDEPPLSLAEAARLLPKRPNPATLWRWRKKGVRGVRLQTILIGGRRYVTRAALQQFIEAVTAAASASAEPSLPSKPLSADQRRMRSDETRRRLKREGLLSRPRRRKL
jgi:Protein of unknown function (DUF1580)